MSLNSLAYYKASPPKSLGREWTDEHILPLISENQNTVDLLRTFVEHAAFQIAKVGEQLGNNKTIFLTGGGTFNSFLLERIGAIAGPNYTYIISG